MAERNDLTDFVLVLLGTFALGFLLWGLVVLLQTAGVVA